MAQQEGTVFVLGAGFTKAFLPSAPLLVDDYFGSELSEKYKKFTELHSILDLELAHPDHDPGKINLERLMTRLAGGMPYDYSIGVEQERTVLLADVKRKFFRRLDEAKSAGGRDQGELWLFAGSCVRDKATCITFNYDDLLDEALWGHSWRPNSGYGFPCRSSAACVDSRWEENISTSPMQLLKLHGSVNWRIPLGHPQPYAVDSIRHHESWFEYFGHVNDTFSLKNIERLLEPDLFIVPPVMAKTDLIEQPVLGLIWSLAINALKAAKRVVFIGYSMPITDIAASFLFREGLGHLDPSSQVTVVDYAREEEEKARKLAWILPAYQAVFPGITEDRFQFCGAVDWVRSNLITDWLYDSKGEPVAFVAFGCVISRGGQLIGTIGEIPVVGPNPFFPDANTLVWSGPHERKIAVPNFFSGGKWADSMKKMDSYKCEIVPNPHGNRLLCRTSAPPDREWIQRIPRPLLPAKLPRVPHRPGSIPHIDLPSGFEDIKLETRQEQ
jgi:hypothetical protein